MLSVEVLMEAVLVTVGFVMVVACLVRVAIGFLRWSRKQPGASFGRYLQESLGDWVDRTSESPPWFPYEGSADRYDSPYDSDDGRHGD